MPITGTQPDDAPDMTEPSGSNSKYLATVLSLPARSALLQETAESWKRRTDATGKQSGHLQGSRFVSAH